MADWWDQIGTNIGSALIAPQTFGGLMPMPTDPAQRQQMIGPALLTLGAGLFQGARQGQGPLEAFSSAYGGLQQQGAQQGQQRLQGMLLGSKLQEQQKRNQTRERLKKNPPAGMTPEMIDLLSEEQIGKLFLENMRNERMRQAYGVGAPGMGGPASAPAPSGGSGGTPSPGGVFDVPQQFAPQVQAAAQKYGVPVELLASTFYNESRWNPNARNDNDQGPGIPSLGLGQWGEQWARARGFDPMDPNASIEHTAQAMAEYAKRYGGNFMLARLAYGWGPGNVDKWLQAGGDPNKVPDGAKVWLPRTAFGIADEREARAAFPRVAQMLRPGPVQMPWGQTASVPPMQTAGTTAPNPVTPVQYTPGQGGQQPDPASDPELQALLRARQAAAAANNWDEVPKIDQAIARRRGQLADRPAEMERAAAQGRQRAEIARDTEILKIDVKDAAKIWEDLQNNGLKSRTALANLRQLERLSEGMQTGRFTPTTQEIKRIAKGLGIDLEAFGIKDNVAQGEAIAALANQMALQFRDPSSGAGMPGAMSDADRQFLLSMVPGLATTPEGRKLMIGYLKRIHEYNIGMAKAVGKYRESADWKKNPTGLARVAQEYADANQIAFGEEEMQNILRLARGPQAQPIPTNPPPDPEASGRLKQKYGLD